MPLRALFADRRYHATPGYESVTLVPVDVAGPPIVVPYSDPQLQLQPSWWRWQQCGGVRLLAPLPTHDVPVR